MTTVTSNAELLLLKNRLALQDTTFDTSGAGTLSFDSLTRATVGGLQGTGSLTLTNSAAPPAAVAPDGGREQRRHDHERRDWAARAPWPRSAPERCTWRCDSYQGGSEINGLGGTVQIGDPSRWAHGNLAVDAGTLDLNGQSCTVSLLTSSFCDGLVTNYSIVPCTLTVNQSGNSAYYGSICDGNARCPST